MATKRPQYTSKGERPNVSRNIINGIKADLSAGDKMISIQKAWLKNQNPWITIDNPDTSQTNKLRITVRTNAYWGHPFFKKQEHNPTAMAKQ